MPQENKDKNRGFGGMDEEKQRQVASKGGQASGGGNRSGGSESDRRHQDNLDPGTRSEAGRKGGEAMSEDREHMSEIGKKGGERRGSQNR